MEQKLRRINIDEEILILMSHIKIGDFLLLVPYLRLIKNSRREKVTIAVPDILFPLLKNVLDDCIAMSALQSRERGGRILDLSFPLLETLRVPSDHELFAKEHFEKFQYVGKSYAEALKEFFEEISPDMELKPYLECEPDEELLRGFGLRPFRYFTVHAGSDFAPKNWPNENFEQAVVEIHKLNPDLFCVGLVGPCDRPLFQGEIARNDLQSVQQSNWFQNISVPLEQTAAVLAGSLFHLDNDSGIHHLAGVLDVPCITVWGPTGPGTWHSLSSRNFIHWGGPNCADHCGGSRMKECADRVCLTSVRPEELVESVQRILAAYKV